MPPDGCCLRNNVFFPFSCQLEALECGKRQRFSGHQYRVGREPHLFGQKQGRARLRHPADRQPHRCLNLEFGDTLKAVGMTRTVISARSDELGEEARQPRQKNLDLESL